jgi:hypothetical protein
MMPTQRYLLILLLALVMLFPACRGEQELAEAEGFSFVVYPGARYLGQLSEHTKQAHRMIDSSQEPPPVAIYDTEAPLDEVAQYYAEQYGYGQIAPEQETSTAASAPRAHYRTGDLATDVMAIEELLRKMELETDVSKATGAYRAVEIKPRPNRPRVTISRPYFDVTTSEVVDRTLILMSRDRPPA